MSITEVEDLTMFCRVCLQLPAESELLDLNLIYDEDEQLTYYDCFTMCTQIQISDGEGLPQNLCRSCGLELQMAYDFYKKVDESKRFLIQLQDQNTKALLPATEEELGDTTPLVGEEEEVVEQDQEQEQEQEHELDQEEVDVEEEEHLDMEEYQAVEHLDDEDNAVNEIRHCNGKYSFMNAISGASKNNLVYHREANHYKEYTHNVPNKMPLEIVGMKHPVVTDVGNLEATYNLEYDSFISEDYKQIKEESLSSEIGDIYEMIHGTGVTEENQKRRRANFKSALQKNAADITLYNGNTAEEEQNIDCVGENNSIGIDNHENKTLEEIHSENLQLYSAAKTEESASNPAGIDVSCDAETILHTSECNATQQADDTQNHLISFEARPQYECGECRKRFIKFRNYNNHLKTHNLASMHKCTKCDMIYLRVTSLERHMEQFHTSPDQVDDQRCHFCQKFYTSKYALKIHMRFHTGDLPCECSTCGKRFSDNGHLRQHIRVKHQQFRFKCVHDNCGKIFETDRALRNHGYEHDKNWPFLCAHCGKGMGTKYNCRTHIFKRHKIYATDDELNAMQQFKRKKVSQSHCFQKVPNAKLKYTKDK